MVPVPKDKRGSKSDSNNYRAIAIISILGKLFDSIIIKEQHSSLITDDLQFGFKENSSTIICTQLLIETIDTITVNTKTREHGSQCPRKLTIGYEPADLTVHPPPKRSRVGSFFSHRCLVPQKCFPQRKSGFCRRYSH